MILRSIRLHNVRRFTDPVIVRGIEPGLNVLAAPNEKGKSTILDALHAMFFRDRKSFDKRIKSLVPHAGGTPKVIAEIERDGTVFRLEKSWGRGSGKSVKVFVGDRLHRQADDAEEWIRGVMKPPERGGPAGLLWVRQGQVGFDLGDKRSKEGAHLARRNMLTSSIESEVDAMTGGRKMEVAQARCDEELGRYVTATRREKKGGPLTACRLQVDEIAARVQGLKQKSIQLKEELTDRKRKRRILDDLRDPDGEAERRRRLEEAEKAYAAAHRHAQQLENARTLEDSKRLEAERAKDRCDTLLRDVLERGQAMDEYQRAKKAAAEVAQDVDRYNEALVHQDTLWKEAIKAAERARTALELSRRRDNMVTVEARRAELVSRLEQALVARRELETARAEERTEVPPEEVERLGAMVAHIRSLQRDRDREATAITMNYVPGQEGAVRMGTRDLEHGMRIAIPEGTLLDIAGIGRLRIHADQRVDDASLRAARNKLQSRLQSLGHNSIEDARASLGRRQAAGERRRDAEVKLRGVAPDGIDRLRAHLAELPEEDEMVLGALLMPDARLLDAKARRDLEVAVEAKEHARRHASEAERRLERLAATQDSAEARLRRVRVVLQGIEEPDVEVARREATHARLLKELKVREKMRYALEEAAPDMSDVRSRLERARSVIARADEEKARLREVLAKLDTSIELQDGNAVEEELADAQEQLVAAEIRLKEILHEVAVLVRLKKALTKAQKAARDRYVDPVKKELLPLLRMMWPGGQISWDAEEILPDTFERAGTTEKFSVLSGGTQEQIAILVRLAFARMLARRGTPAPAILDDAIVYTDDDRIEAMFDVLTRQAKDLQIIVLTCRQKAFRELGGKALRIEPAS